ncbi:AsmA family protein [Chitinophaga tropicalis]|uniref:AsmA domain-containing protein n=1 Tax=Chitinophaga tropicalis TaxID=2683588 RepID=A0A7K1UA43_9BACT|nr:AsmA-like C-terminal region-containing protein [Chitinophaga tropicalis]MVT11237.1 hypothetical protein [Chitinophaga tropicalis]
MRKWLRITFIVSGSLLGLLILLWLGLALYIKQNKARILQQISSVLSDRLHGGQLQIRNMEPSLIQSFPNVSVTLEDVTVRDSLWNVHGHDLINVSRIFIKVNTFSLLKKQLDIKRISLVNGSITLYTDSTGYHNTEAMGRRTKTSTDKGRAADITGLEMEDMKVVIDNRLRNKLFRFDITSLKGSLRNNDTGWVLNMRTDLVVKSLAFNLEKGSYLAGKRVEANLELQFNREKKVLNIPQQAIRIAGQSMSVGAAFAFGEKAGPYSIHIIADKLPYSTATSLLTPKIEQKLNNIAAIEKPLDVDAQLKGHLRQRGTPFIYVTWKTTGNTVTTKGLELQECTFGGRYSNERVKDSGYTDENSIVSIYGLTARTYGMPAKADTIHISNLKHPTLTGYFTAEFPLTDLNNASGEEGVFTFTGGRAKAALFYKGGLTPGDTVKPFLKGTVQLQQGEMEYTPRNLPFKNCNATLDFNGYDLFLRDISIQTQKSSLQMEGSIRNIAVLYFAAPEKLVLNWSVKSPLIDLDEFRTFLSQRKGRTGSRKSAAANRRKVSRIAAQLDVVLSSCIVNLQMQLDKLNYGNFTARQVNADLSLSGTGVQLNKIGFRHAGGIIDLAGTLTQEGGNNRFKINAGISSVHIDQLFHAFNNFGMQSLTSKNLKGILNANAALTGNIKDNGKMSPQSLYGTLAFDLRQGALLHFAPLEDLGDLVFRKRDMGNITFENLKNTLTLQGSRILIPPMQINSSALYMDVSGVYGINAGTSMYIDVPLRNPKKDEDVTDKEEKRKNRRKGIVLHLHATDGENGKIKFKLGGRK